MFGGRAWYEELIADLASLLDAGIPLVEALETLAGQRDPSVPGVKVRVSRPRARVAAELLREVVAGRSLAEAFRACREEIAPEHAALVSAGERAGRTTDMLRRIIADVQRRTDVFAFTRGRYGRYFICLVFAAFVVLPVPLLLTSGAFIWYPVYLTVLGLFGFVLCLVLRGSFLGVSLPDSVRQSLFNAALVVPGLGEQLQLRWYGRALWLLGTLVESGLPLSEAIPLVADATRVERFRVDLGRVSDLVSEEKSSLAQGLSHLDAFRTHPDWLTRVTAGERAGRLDGALLELAQSVEERAQNRALAVAALIPVVFIFLIGAAVLFVWIRVYSNLYNFEV